MYLSKVCIFTSQNIVGRWGASSVQLQMKSLSLYFARSLTHYCVYARSPSSTLSQRSYSRSIKANTAHAEVDIFPNRKHTLDQLKQKLQARLGPVPMYTFTIKSQGKGFICDVKLNWPEPLTFSATGPNKKTARKAAFWQAVQWLYSNECINEKSEPNFKEEATLKNNVFVKLSDSVVTEVDSVLEMYSKEIAPAVSEFCRMKSFSYAGHKKNTMHPTLGIPFPTPEDLVIWNMVQPKRIPESKVILPIDKYRKEIVQSLKSNRVIILEGETGCGKTTKVPQYILDDAIANGSKAYCNIAVVQPRRITTIETAKYVAKERRETLGESIGFSVKMSSVFPSVPGGSITFMTGMKLALKFTSNPSLKGVSHVVLDEVHLRDIGTDLVMVLLKQAMEINENLRVIIMSATVDTGIFQSYFSQFGDVPVVEVPGRTFPVKMHFLNDLPSKISHSAMTTENDSPVVDYPLVQRVVSWINEEKPFGAILIFVSGWNDMVELQKLLSSLKNLVVIPVHSMFRDCSAAFEPARKGLRKVILATNVAETSLTFPDVVYVIDCGVHKKPQRNLLSPGGWSSKKISTEWVTKANVFQRKGRAGRVQPGESYHLFPQATFESMDDYELPGILSDSLEHLVLSIKMVSPESKAEDLLEKFPDPPSKRDVRSAVRTLQNVSLLSREDEKPTPLASAVMNISSSLPSALALIYSAIFRCFDTCVSVISCADAPLILGSRTDTDSSSQRSLKANYHESSDHLAKGKIINDRPPALVSQSSYYQTRNLKTFLSKQINSMSKQLKNADLNEHTNEELVKSILLKSFGSLLVKHYSGSMKARMIDKSGIFAAIKSKSVNHKLEKFESPFAMYLSGEITRGTLFINDTSVASPLSVLLFLPSRFFSKDDESENVAVYAWKCKDVTVVLTKAHMDRVQKLRAALRDVEDYFVIAEALNQPDENYDRLCEFRRKLLDCVGTMLTDS